MTPETKALIEEVKKRCADYQPTDMLKHAWDDLPKLIAIIESQEKEIEILIKYRSLCRRLIDPRDDIRNSAKTSTEIQLNNQSK